MSNSAQWTEQETRTRLITPAIVSAGWDINTQVREDYALTAGRIVVRGQTHTRQRPKRADYVLNIRGNIPLAVVEAKDTQHQPGAGMQQALVYADMLDVPFAISTNGHEFLLHDRTVTNGPVEQILAPADVPSPDELWQRYRAWKGLDYDATKVVQEDYYIEDPRKTLRYYQTVAVNRAVEAVAAGQRRLLLVMATGTGKTLTAFQIMWRLRKAGVAKRILFLVDRNVLADQALVNDFAAFGPVMTKVSHRNVDKSYEVYLALYQSLTGPDADQEIYRQFSPDFFDLVVVDECHRGSASEDSAWRAVLEYFHGAVQIGLTATPKETAEVSNIEYFGAPVYTYSLKNGIDDGFLAPFHVRRIELDRDLGGWRPTSGQRDRHGNVVPDRVYTGRDYDRTVVLDRRSPVVAESITKFMKEHDRLAKTIVFCEDIEHAERMRQELVNANADITATNSKYVVRITGDSEYGLVDLDSFMDPNSPYPVIVTTSKLLTTGVDVPTCKVIVLDQTINSLTEFKQIIGRGTRVREDLGKISFTILDYRGATQLFADPDFDGAPEQVKADEDDDDDNTQPGNGAGGDGSGSSSDEDGDGHQKYYVDGVEVSVLQERVQYFDPSGQLITESLRDYTKSKVMERYPTKEQFVADWLMAEKKELLIDDLAEHGVLFEALEQEFGAGYDPYDLILSIGFDAPATTRGERADAVRATVANSAYSEKARAVLDMLLTKYAREGPIAIEDNQVLRLRPLSNIGTPVEIIGAFGGRAQYEAAIRELATSIYTTTNA